MKFTQLRLAGFKSFVDPTELRIDPGLTGVIGPNGCGKSNLLEALRWVMGATSAKSLRGSGMEDVIFAGTDARPARDRAEVVLTIDNEDKLAPPQFNEAAALDISRRIGRGIGSTYKINGEEVRAKDVQLLFADAGTGANSPALVRQGQISELIAAKPENRRRVLEEAAGVAGLRARRHEAELRLKGAEANLDRLQEVIDETDARHGALQRQARQASRYRKLSSSIRTLEAALWLNRWREASSQAEEAEAELADKRQAAEDAIRQAAELRTQAEIASALRDPLREAEAEAEAALRRVERERDQIERDAADIKRAIRAMEMRLDELAKSAEREQQIAADADQARQRATSELEILSQDDAAQERSQAAADAASRDAEERRKQRDAVLDTRASELAEHKAALESAAKAVASLHRRRDDMQRQIQRARDELARLTEQGRDSDLAAAREAVEIAETRSETARATLDRAEQARQQADDTAQTRLAARDEQMRAVAELDQEISALDKVLSATLDETVHPAIDQVRARPGYEHALAAALGEDLQASLDADEPRYWQETSIRLEQLPGGCVPLSDHVDAPPALKARLRSIGVIKPEQAHTARRQLKPGQRLVTREGDLWRWDGLTVKAGAPSASVAVLEQRNRREALVNDVEALRPGCDQARTVAENALAEQSEARSLESQARQAVAPAEQALRQAVQAEANLKTQTAQHQARLVALSEGVERLVDEAASLDREIETAEAEQAALPPADTKVEALNKARAEAETARLSAADARAALEAVRREVQIRQQRRKQLQGEHSEWSMRLKAAESRIADMDVQRDKTLARLADARSKPDQLETALDEIAQTLKLAEAKAQEARDAARSTEDQVKAADTAARQAETAASAAREGRAAAEARLSGARDRLADTTARLQDATGEAPGALAHIIKDADLDSLSLAELERRLDEARRSRERLGAVNLRADEEAEELASKRDEMIKERDDLIAAIDKLRKAVETLSREGRTRLLAAFDVVDGHFRTLFSTLFEGGQAELRLTENDDPLEAGLEIFACPPGKKMDKMTLMSGGEQALTASALIFAVFLANPAPVCVLDEVDAPLDDANVDRYCRMLERMKQMTQTRFLVITHNALTMSRMDRLYGVTMAERGVSQLVSVNLSDAEQLVAAE
ncbi:chromosome segregation protein SMC [Maricaulis sp. D1M11]|uniref:chromosome segregation protein SMC n=1 Tax=Maricaulis sp. D1M11 TaxID=3076117 RepID=UPI0039B3C323